MGRGGLRRRKEPGWLGGLGNLLGIGGLDGRAKNYWVLKLVNQILDSKDLGPKDFYISPKKGFFGGWGRNYLGGKAFLNLGRFIFPSINPFNRKEGFFF